MDELSTTTAQRVFWQGMADLNGGQVAHAMWLAEITPLLSDDERPFLEGYRRAAWSRVADNLDELGRELRRVLTEVP